MLFIALMFVGVSNAQVSQDCDVESEFSINANGHEYVDLGLSVLWSTCNVGAIKVEDIGGYYAWGETEVIGDYDDYLYRPTADEFMELVEKCDWLSENYHGMMGFRVTGPNGNSIFLPAAGGDDVKGNDPDVGEDGNYWTSTMRSEDNGTKYEWARCFEFTISSEGTTIEEASYYGTPYDDFGMYRSIGCSVRPVMNR